MAQRIQVRQCVAVCGLLLAVPASVQAVDVVVGNGTPGSCTEAALNSAVLTVVPPGGTIRFNCGGAATINLTTQKVFSYSQNPTRVYTIDGGGLITLNGGGVTRHIYHRTGTLNVQNITFTGGRARGDSDDASGGAIRSDRLLGDFMGLNLANVTFVNNATELTSWSAPFSPFDYGGGAVFTRWGIVTINNCYFANNTANNSSGGALHGRSSTVSMSSSVFTSNVSNGGGFGGGVYFDGLSPGNLANGSLQIVNSNFTANTAWGMGGGVFWFLYPERNESVSINAINVVGNAVVDSGVIPFVGNRGFGGGLAGDAGNVVIQNSTFANNSVRGQVATNGGGAGGGLWLFRQTTAVLKNITVSGNRAIGNNADAAGGGILIYDTAQPFQIIHSTIVNNQAGWVGGGIHGTSSNGIITDTVIANNSATAFPTVMQQCSVQFGNGGGALQYPDITGSPGPGNPRCANSIMIANPQLGPLASNGGFSQTHHPLANSPLINVVGCAATTDQRGVARPQGPLCDIGSVEVACSLTLTPLTLPTGRVGTPYSQTFSAAGGSSPFAFSQSGALPTGMAFSNGILSGTPSQSGAFSITVTVTDGSGCSAVRTYNLAIASAVAMTPVTLDILGNNGVLTPNSTVVVDPGWRNATGGAVGLTGTLSRYIGPPGATYTLVDGVGSYGTVANGATARCSTTTADCYAVSITASARPEVHWDASAVETLSAGGPKAWTLHVGGSFTDVPASSLFFRDVETLLHRGITTGCGGSSYCPGSGTTREQMAVFVLLAKEGAGYAPPACSPPNTFADVPATSPFCRYIEELARRGIASGCGGGNYCPATAVTREQMAVFVLRTLDPALNPPACSPPNTFGDVPETSGFCRWIEELARRGVVGGCGGGNYCPTGPVTRDQMGVFLSGTFGLTLYGP